MIKRKRNLQKLALIMKAKGKTNILKKISQMVKEKIEKKP
jgi:hypothetical protein